MTQTFTINVPATSANLGPGFDCIGVALNLANQFKFTRIDSSTSPDVKITVTGQEADRVDVSRENLVYQAFTKLYQDLGQAPPNVAIEINLAVPLARGLGSSATAIVGGLVGANCLAGYPLGKEAVSQLAIEMEGHPDNVVPALLGGCCLAAKTGDSSRDWTICDVPWHKDIIPVLSIPNFELSTETARKVLPTNYSRADAIFNVGHLGLLLRGLETGIDEWLSGGMFDQIHQPYRKVLIPGYDAIYSAALEAGAYGTVISGAGPSMLTLVHKNFVTQVTQAISKTWETIGNQAEVKVLKIDLDGTTIDETEG